MKSSSTKGVEELLQEVHQAIRRFEEDLQALQLRLTPGQLIDDAIYYRQGRNLGAAVDHLKRNYLATTLLLLGTFMLIKDDQPRYRDL